MNESVEPTSTLKPFLSERQRRVLIALLVLIGLFFVTFYGLRAYRGLRQLIEGTQPIVRPWMTIPRIAHQFKIPQAELYRALAVQPERPDRRPLDRLAREKGLKIPVFVDQVQRFVDSYHKPPLPAPPLPAPSPSILPTPTPLQTSLLGTAHAQRS